MNFNLKTEIHFSRVRMIDKMMLAKNLAMMLKAGLNITEALAVVKDQATGRLKKILGQVLKSVITGSSLAMSFNHYQKILSPYFIKMIYSGEQSGTLERSLDQVAAQLKKDYQSKQNIKNALMYPAIVLLTLIIVGTGLTFFVLPRVANFFTGFNVALPLATRILIKLGAIINQSGILILVGAIILVVIIIFLTRLKFLKIFFHYLILQLPIIGKVSYYINLSRLADLLGTLLKSGLPITEAIKVTEETLTNQIFVRAVAKIASAINEGQSLTQALISQNQLFPLIFIRLIQSGEQSGNLEESLLSLAEYYSFEIDNKIKNLTVVLEPILLLAIGLVVAFVALAIITPIYKLTGAIRN